MAEILGGGVKFGGLAIFNKIRHSYTCQIPFKANLLNFTSANISLNMLYTPNLLKHIAVSTTTQ